MIIKLMHSSLYNGIHIQLSTWLTLYSLDNFNTCFLRLVSREEVCNFSEDLKIPKT